LTTRQFGTGDVADALSGLRRFGGFGAESVGTVGFDVISNVVGDSKPTFLAVFDVISGVKSVFQL